MATQYAFGQIAINGLVLALNAADRNSYMSGSTTWNDLSGNGNNGILTVSGSNAISASYNSTNGGNIGFSGTGSYILVSGSTSLQPASQVTLDCSFIRNSGRTITSYSDESNGSSKIYSFEHQSLFQAKVTTTSGQTVLSGPTIPANTWYNTVMTYNGVTASLYINGALYTSSPTSGSIVYSANANLNIGRKNLGDGEYISGSVASVRVYNRALTAEEVLQNYNAQKARFGLT
jgi:hypothetical protein